MLKRLCCMLLALLLVLPTTWTVAEEAAVPGVVPLTAVAWPSEGNAAAFQLNVPGQYVPVGKTVALTAMLSGKKVSKGLTWVSGDEGIVTVADGKLKGIAQGNTTVTCAYTDADGAAYSAVCEVAVVKPVTKVAAGSAKLTLCVGDSVTPEITVAPEDASIRSLGWISADEAVVTVSAEGVLTALAPGTSVVTCTAMDGSKKTAKLTVTVPTIKVDQTALTISTYQKYTIPVTYYGDNAENVTVKAGNKNVLTDYADGVLTVTPNAVGECVITVSDKKSAASKVSISVTVEESMLDTVTPDATLTLTTGAQGLQVMVLQKALAYFSFYHGTPNGKFDKATKTAVRGLQLVNSMARTDGVADPETLNKLYNDKLYPNEIVYVARKGKRYHSKDSCSNMRSPKEMWESDAIEKGYTMCQKCW